MIMSLVGKASMALAIGGLTVAGLTGPAHAAADSGWQVAATIAPNNEEVQLNAVTAISAQDAWAVGDIGTADGSIVEHWNGTAWQQIAVPTAVTAKMQDPGALGATSDSNVWAFDFGGRWLRYNGSSWSSGQVPVLPGGQRSGLGLGPGLAVGSHDAWAFGFNGTATAKIYSYAAYFNGSKWQAMSLPGPTGEYGVTDASAVSASDIWAVNAGGPGERTANGLVHWNGQRWNSVSLPSSVADKDNLTSVLALPGGDVWVAGGIPDGASKAQGVTALWNGHTWTVDKLAADPSAPDDVIGDMIPDGSGGVWAMGFTTTGCAGPMWHYTAGAWADTGTVGCSVDAYVHGPQGLANIPGTTSDWAVGGQYDASVPNGEAGLVMLYGPQA
jgi:hypothetical protein